MAKSKAIKVEPLEKQRWKTAGNLAKIVMNE
jgi:hypothetical protein